MSPWWVTHNAPFPSGLSGMQRRFDNDLPEAGDAVGTAWIGCVSNLYPCCLRASSFS